MVTFVAIILLVAIVMGVLHYRLLEGYFRRAAASQLTAQGPRLQTLVEAVNVPVADTGIVRQLAAAAASITQSRALVTDVRGMVLVDTTEGKGLTGETISASLISRVLRGRIEAFDFPTAGTDAVAVAIPWVASGRVTGTLIIIRSVRIAARQITGETSSSVLKAAFLASAAAAVVAYFLSSTITNPLRKMAQVARSVSKGSFKEKVDVKSADELGDLAEALNSMSDEISALIDNLTQEKEKLRALMEERTNMMSDISHDLRTPVTSIRGFVEALRDGIIKDESEKSRTLNIIHEESERLARLVDDLFYLARLESGEIPVEMKEVDLPAVVRSSVQTILPIAREKQVDVILTSDEAAEASGLLRVVGSADRLTRAILNVLDNAIKYSPENGQVRVLVLPQEVEVPGKRGETVRRAVVSVADQGPGIPEQDISHVFERFYRADKARSRAKSGAGLGLSIARLIVEQHGGSMWAQSVMGQGSTFSFAIPTSPPP
jgi:signal transduction histidine kinase